MVAHTHHTEPNQLQRIYVGGIDPSRGLTVSEVWQRLEAKLTNPGDGVPSLKWSDLHCGNCCLQVTITSDDMEQSPLKIVKSSFHNVMWKGCKLIVDVARPHFLQRLQEERNLRQRKESLDSNDMENGRPQTSERLTEPQQLSRYWKVRRGYCGEPVRHIDTQSCDVTSWSMFERIRQRHKKQQEKDRLRRIDLLKSGTNMTVKEAQKRAYYNRSIRMRFTDEMDMNASSCSDGNKLILDDVTSSDQSIDNSEDNETVGSLESSRNVQNESGKYVWSDDESDNVKTTNFPNVENDESHVNVSAPHIQVAANRSTYIWSDDDDNSSDSDISTDLTKHKYSKLHDLGEFESALELTKDDSIALNEMTAIDDNNDDNKYDIAMDVERNLAILSQLFPETSKVPAAPNIANTVIEDREKKILVPTPPVSSGWGASGQMLRFDPSRPLSTSFLLKDDISNQGNNPVSAIENSNTFTVHESPDQSSEDDHGSTVQNPTVEAVEVTATTKIYEQKKLEQVFKEAREGIPIISSDRIDGGASFAFGFEVDDEAKQDEAASSTFTFNFGINENKQDNFGVKIVNDIGADGITTQDAVSSTGSRPRFRAFEFPSEDMLNEMVNNFYFNINDGERIIRDVDMWRNDPSVKEKWLKDRLALTQDWKRKRKFALSKKQKRSKKV